MVSVWGVFLFLWVLGMGYVILLWHSLSFHILFRILRDCIIYAAKTKALISCSNTMRISRVTFEHHTEEEKSWGFVFAYAKSRFSHEAAQITSSPKGNNHSPERQVKSSKYFGLFSNLEIDTVLTETAL